MSCYLGTFFITFATLAMEVTLTRLLSVVTWYHMAFFAISIAMLGMTAGSTTVYLQSERFNTTQFKAWVGRACHHFAWTILLTLAVLCLLPMPADLSAFSFLALLLMSVVCFIPFYFSGIAVAGLLTRSNLPIGKLYAVDLAGASLGCLFVLAGFTWFDAPSLMILIGAFGFGASFFFMRDGGHVRFSRWSAILALLFATGAVVNNSLTYNIQPIFTKGNILFPFTEYDRWNSFSRVTVSQPSHTTPFYWGPSPIAPQPRIEQRFMAIDGEAGTAVTQFERKEDINYLAYDITNIAYHLRPHGGACIIGIGGGRDVQSAVLFGHEDVYGLEVNPIFVTLLTNEFRDFAGIGKRENVHLVVDEARSWLTHTDKQFALIQMSLIDTWAATGVGAFATTENGLYTLESWKIMLSRLKAGGVFTVSRWHNPQNLGETGRIVSLAVATLLDLGIKNPIDHIAMVALDNVATLMVSRDPLSKEDLVALGNVVTQLKFKIIFAPGQSASIPLLAKILAAESTDKLVASVADEPLNYVPTTDDTPYFFHMLKLTHLQPLGYENVGVIRGNLIAMVSLAGLILVLAALCLITIFVPLLRKSYQRESPTKAHLPALISGAGYFAFIGAGFMFIEIGLIQRFSIILGHPTYGLGIILFTIILTSGLGSYFTHCRMVKRWFPWFPLLIAVYITAIFSQSRSLAWVATLAMHYKIIITIACITLPGLMLGTFFPMGMNLMTKDTPREKPWFWALNGIFGVLCSALAILVAINLGISYNFYIGCACYLLIIPVRLLRRASSS